MYENLSGRNTIAPDKKRMHTTPMDTFAGLDGCMEQHPTGSRKCLGSVPQPAI